ncbi:MAG: flagellar basal body rod protein FlgC [Novosphingobium sp.]|nr:flagellar basal body rod protein FlgC [Novosphingobium sp.]
MPVDPVAISRSALDVEWQRMQVIALNLANENTVSTTAKGGYRPLALVSGPDGNFAGALQQGTAITGLRGVAVKQIVERPNPVRSVYDPGNPAADAAGFVSYPNIDHAQEMVSLMRTARSYESNLTVLSLAQQMAMRALDIGRR